MPKTCEEISDSIAKKSFKLEKLYTEHDDAESMDDQQKFDELSVQINDTENDLFNIVNEGINSKCGVQESPIAQSPNLCEDKKRVFGKLVLESSVKMKDAKTDKDTNNIDIEYSDQIKKAIQDVRDTCRDDELEE